MSEKTYGVIQEQGDLGLGFTPATDDEKEVIKEAVEKDNEK